MAENKRIAVAGAGSLGKPVIRALAKACYPVTVLTRSRHPKPLDLDIPADIRYATVDYQSSSSLASALRGHFGVASTITSTAAGEQDPLIQAAVEVGVQRFIPAEFGADMANQKTRALPVFGYKAAAEDKLVETAKTNPTFTYSLIRNGVFLDWGLEMTFLLNLKEHTATIFDTGDQPFSTTTLATVADAVVGVFEHLDETRNRAVYVHDTVITQNDLLRIAQSVDGSAKDWKVERVTSDETVDKVMAVLGKEPSAEQIGEAMVDFLCMSINAEGYGGDISDKTDNALLGNKRMDESGVREVIKKYL